jgi:hypothetical protein
MGGPTKRKSTGVTSSATTPAKKPRTSNGGGGDPSQPESDDPLDTSTPRSRKPNLNWKKDNWALLHTLITCVEREENWVIFGGKDPEAAAAEGPSERLSGRHVRNSRLPTHTEH